MNELQNVTVSHFFVSVCQHLCSTEPSQNTPASSLSLMLCGLSPSVLPRVHFPVPFSFPAIASLDFVSDFPRKRLHGSQSRKQNLPDAQPGKVDQTSLSLTPVVQHLVFALCISKSIKKQRKKTTKTANMERD